MIYQKFIFQKNVLNSYSNASEKVEDVIEKYL